MLNKDINISHIRTSAEGKFEVQTNEEHSHNVAELAKKFAQQFGMPEWGYLIGLLHDRGKDRFSFQQYIRQSNGLPYKHWSGDKDHAYIGALVAQKTYPNLSMIIGNDIAGHHRGLYNTDELQSLLKSPIPEGIDTIVPKCTLNPPHKIRITDVNHVCRMLFSCLVDADYLDTEQFMCPETSKLRAPYEDLQSLSSKMDCWLNSFKSVPDNALNSIRGKIQQCCREKANNSPGFFELTVPTGGGKTISSMVWAINHALKFGKRRIIIALPYTSIIIQTAQILRSIFGDENVLEHHSVVNEDKEDERIKLASENWDSPIIVTTNVQLFESFFANKPSKCRKLHNIANSVIILDEAQAIPRKFLQPILDALKCYVYSFEVSVLFCTASQPVLTGVRNGRGATLNGIDSKCVTPLIAPNMRLHDILRRVSIEFKNEPYTSSDIASMVSDYNRCLCIVNTRKLALEIFKLLPNGQGYYHLSRMMCPMHIRHTLNNIKDALSNCQTYVRVISTQLIEAGVDIDFPIVMRQKAGLDSILQSAGRCNREGKQTTGQTIVFDIAGHKDYGEIKSAVYATNELYDRNAQADWFAPETVSQYYNILYSKTDSFDEKGISQSLANPYEAAYETAANAFHLIDDTQNKVVIVNYGDADKLIRQVKEYGLNKTRMRQLGQYAVSIPMYVFNSFLDNSIAEEVSDGIFYVSNPNQYDDTTGLLLENKYLEQINII